MSKKLAPPADLTIPLAGSTTARAVLSGAMTHLLPELVYAGRGIFLSPTLRNDFQALTSLYRAVLKASPGALPSLGRRVHVSALVRALRAGPNEALFRELYGLCLFELANASALPEPIRQEAPPKRIVSPAAELVIVFPESTKAIVYKNKMLVVEAETKTTLDLASFEDKEPGFSVAMNGVLVSRPFYSIAPPILLALADNNPLAMFEAHPDKEGNAIDLGGKEPGEWTGMLRNALDLVAEVLPDLRAEMDLYVQQIVPVGYHDQKHLSASYQEAIGTIYMTLHPSLMTMTEALIHEFSHNKINALFELDPLLENAFSPLYTSPVRPDPRPLHGVLLAVHAFLPVARLYERMIERGHPLAKSSGFEARFADIRRINAEGASVVLTNGKPTEIGKAVLDEIRQWDGYYAKQAVPTEPRSLDQ